MELGLKRGIVRLVDHDPKWASIADQTIDKLWKIFGSLAKDIQHVGSTAITSIKAKPIIDIAVAVDDFAVVERLVPQLEEIGFLKSKLHAIKDDILFCDDNEITDTRSFHIHIVRMGSPQWNDYLRFRDYLNSTPDVAKKYERLKMSLAEKYPSDRNTYTSEKDNMVAYLLNEARALSMLCDIPDFIDFTKIKPITKGWSSDKKYYIETKDNQKLLLRVADISEYERKKAEFDMMKRVAALNIPMSQPVDFGICNNGKSVYQQLTWIDGEDLEDVLPLLSETEQYVLGLRAGKILRKMQSLSVSPASSNWLNNYGRKIDSYINRYHKCEMKFDGDHYFLEYISANRHLMGNQITCFSHDDYHTGNMILTAKNELYIIDFQRFREVEPYHAMSGLVFSAANSPHFATGQIHGYFDGEPPIEFWRLLALYMSAIAINVLPWSIPFGQGEIEFAQKQIADILHWYDNMKNPIPSWYYKQL